jgi:hypothetical protein
MSIPVFFKMIWFRINKQELTYLMLQLIGCKGVLCNDSDQVLGSNKLFYNAGGKGDIIHFGKARK